MGQCCTTKHEVKNESLACEKEILVNLEKYENKNEQINLINKFVLKNLEKIKLKKKYEDKITDLQSVFCNQVLDPFSVDLDFYKERFSIKLKDIIRRKKIFFEDLSLSDIVPKLNSFNYLRDRLSDYYNEEIYNNQIIFYNDFVLSLQESEKMKKLNDKKSQRKSLNTNFMNFMSKNSQGSIIFAPQCYTGFKMLNFGEIKFDKEQKYLKKDIEIIYKYCFDIEKLSNFAILKKKSKLLYFITQVNDTGKKLNVTGRFKYFIKILYYIILLKKCNHISSTGENSFYIINKRKMISLSKKEIDKALLIKYISEDLKMKRENLKKKKEEEKEEEKDDNDYIKTKLTTNLKGNFISNKIGKLTEFEENPLLLRGSNITGVISRNGNNLTLRKPKLSLNIGRNNMIKKNNNTNRAMEALKRRRKVISEKRMRTVIERNPSLVLSNLKTMNPSSKLFKNKKRAINIEEEYYSGQYDNTTYLYAGFGTLIEPEKNLCYTGTFRYGIKDGMGILYENSEDDTSLTYYRGEFKNNKMDGYGEKINAKDNTFCHREGIFKDEIFIQGTLKIIKENLSESKIDVIKYEGEVDKDLFCGYGTLLQKTYTINHFRKYDFLFEKEYKGFFKNGKENGKGTMRFDNGVKSEGYQYTGNFVDGLRDGFGVITYAEMCFIQKYEGFFNKDKPFFTYGIVYFKSGDKYEGFFNANFQKDYVGEYSFYDPVLKRINESYFGGFLEDSKQGLGRIFSEANDECKLMIGNFNLGDKEGNFVMNEYKNEYIRIKTNIKNRRRRMTSWNYGDFFEKKLQRNQKKYYLLMEGNEIMEKSDFPI